VSRLGAKSPAETILLCTTVKRGREDARGSGVAGPATLSLGRTSYTSSETISMGRTSYTTSETISMGIMSTSVEIYHPLDSMIHGDRSTTGAHL
jgi:hypothetical protein